MISMLDLDLKDSGITFGAGTYAGVMDDFFFLCYHSQWKIL
jgi:hypothetical protein